MTRKAPAEYGDGMDTTVGEKTTLTPADHPDLRLEHDVTIYRADGTQTSVSETVYGPKTLDEEVVFSESGASLESMASDDGLSWPALAAARGPEAGGN